jgi:hypothetical protein
MSRIPHLYIVVAFCVAAIGGYAVFSAWVVFYSHDQAQLGDVVGTWKSFATAAFFFWIGSSSAGKAKDGPIDATIVNKPNEPVPAETRP